jgi:hypothetical protein
MYPLQMLKQTFPCHEGCEQMGVIHLLHIMSIVKFDALLSPLLNPLEGSTM